MKMSTINNFRLVIISLATICFLSCQNKPTVPYVITCNDGIVQTENFYLDHKYGLSLQNVNDTIRAAHFVIQSLEDYIYYVSSSSKMPKIDFSSQTLIVGRSYQVNANVVNQIVTSDCKNKEISYNVQLSNKPSALSIFNHYFVIIPKISDSTQVKVFVKYQ